MSAGLRALLAHRGRPEPSLDVGLAAERTAMAWQRTGLALAAVSTLLVRVGERRLELTVPGLLGLLLGLTLVATGERRYTWIVGRVGSGTTPVGQRTVRLLALGMAVLSAAALLFVVTVEI